ncbi:sodium-coupled monocarboxylate transporter 1 isoform X1 [Teleopsis dalmanni]|uniref:sodium-coupled monocarboxylate transporter 1 isoform X1 n=1 Tax=Teleopsis dalmanni TaxID=139649 RepID=UPI0018CCBF21|nr:sodium-coupled monocarboxylate transporter 1 isoform X1 [Teleopsis dalmanni]
MSSSTSEIPVNPSWTVASSESSTESTSSSALSSSTVATIVETVKTFVTTSSTTLNAATISTDNIATHSTSMGTESSSSVAAVMEHNTPANKMNVADLSASLQHFGFVDYFVFVLMLLVCAVIGFYFGFVEKKKKKRNMEERRGSEALDYLVGGRKMKVFPVSLSLVASFVSGISLLGTSTEIYVYGTQYAFILITLALSGVISWYVFLPVFCNLQLTSTYEYFERRFDRRVRLFGSVCFLTLAILWMPISIYVPALTYNQLTGINVHTITPVLCVVCTIYTSIGGIKGVIWTDVLQSFIMVGALLFVVIKGTIDVGGLTEVYRRNLESDRIVLPELTFDPTVRMSMLAVLIGGAVFKLQVCATSQPAVQRFMSLPDMKSVKKTLIVFITGFAGLLGLCIYIGLLAYAAYYNCDPITTKLARAKDQVVPLYVMHTVGSFPGVVGLFISGVFSAALSSLSTLLNSLSGVVLKDFIEPYRSKPLTEFQTAIILRLVVVVFGVSSLASVHIVEKLGMVMQLSATVGSATSGPLLGAFTVGMMMPFVNTNSVFTGCISSALLMTYITVRAQIDIASGVLKHPTKPVSVTGCTYDFNSTHLLNSSIYEAPLFEPKIESSLHHISFLWYTLVGASTTIIVSLLATLYFGKQDVSELDPALIVPFFHRFMKTKKYASIRNLKSANELSKFDNQTEEVEYKFTDQNERRDVL